MKVKLQRAAATLLAIVFDIAIISGVFAQDAPPPRPIDKSKYSPYPQQNFPNRVYFGDTHLHTSYSTDAGMIGCTRGPDEAYRFALGDTVTSSTGLPARLKRPYEFLVVSDHAENLGLAPAIAESNLELLKTEFGKRVHDLVKAGRGLEAYDAWGTAVTKGEDPLKGNHALARSMWSRINTVRDGRAGRHEERPPAALSGHGRVGLFRQIVGELVTDVEGLVRPTSPFADLKRASHDVVWLEPRLVAEVSYSGLMEDRLRDPVLRELRVT